MEGSENHMSVTALRSHSTPDLLLHEHIEQVLTAMQGIWNWHSDMLITSEIRKLCQQIARLHDLGKGCESFQKYISDPQSYSDDPAEKSHTPLSLLLTIQKAAAEKQEPLESLLICACVYGHHSGFPLLPPRDRSAGKQKTIDRFGTDRMYRILPRQIQHTDFAALQKETGISLPEVAPDRKTVRESGQWLSDNVFPALRKLSPENAVDFRLKCQIAFSMLLEADKALLAVRNPEKYLSRLPRHWKSQWVAQKIGNPENTEVNLLRQKARKAVQSAIEDNVKAFVTSLTAPTGLGKTLLAAQWALKHREMTVSQGSPPPKVIVVLPFLSIVDQTSGIYRELLGFGSEKADGSWFLTSHSLSDRVYDTESEEKTASFFIDTWRTELVITTYDQFLMSLIDSKARYQMRFHNLCDSLIIMDEVQSLPCRIWQLLNGVFTGLARTCNTRILLMSATLPPFVSEAKPLLENYADYFRFSRYRLVFRIGDTISIDDFCNEMGQRLGEWFEKRERVLITLNTRRSARLVFDHLKKQNSLLEEYSHVPIFFISADVTPKDRLQKIAEIKKGNPCIVVSTQCIEAGVDIDMTRVIRDFAPWDSLVQIAGRCNREGKRTVPGDVEIADLTDDKGKRYSDMIYDDVHLAVTRRIIGKNAFMGEKDTLDISEKYFLELSQAKDTGQVHLERFAYWEEDVRIHTLLRGEDKKQFTFLVMEQDEELESEMEKTGRIKDRWERREAWRKLAGRIAKISVSVYARYGFRPEEISKEKFGHRILLYGYYDPECGLKTSQQNAVAIF